MDRKKTEDLLAREILFMKTEILLPYEEDVQSLSEFWDDENGEAFRKAAMAAGSQLKRSTELLEQARGYLDFVL